LVRNQNLDVGDDPETIVAEFRQRYYDTQLFYDRYAKGKFARYLFDRHEKPNPNPGKDAAHQLVEEANLFIEACHACDARLAGALAGGVSL
jgi:sulfite reductase (ferredoxin)